MTGGSTSNDVLDVDDEVLSINSDDEEVVLMEVETHPSSTWLIVDETKTDSENFLRETNDDQSNSFPKSYDDSFQLLEIPMRSRLYSLIIAAAVLATIFFLSVLAPRLCYQRMSKVGAFNWPLSTMQKQSNASICSRHGRDKKNDEELFFDINCCLFRAKLYFQPGHCSLHLATIFQDAYTYFWNRTTHIRHLETCQQTLISQLRQLYNTLSFDLIGWTKVHEPLSGITSSLVKSLLRRLHWTAGNIYQSPSSIFVRLFTDCSAKGEGNQAEEGLPTVRTFNNFSMCSSVRKKAEMKIGHYSSTLETLYKYYHTLNLPWKSSKSSYLLDNNFATKVTTAAANGASNITEHQFLPGYIATYYNYSALIIDTTWVAFKKFTIELVQSIKEEMHDDGNSLSFPEFLQAARNYSNHIATTFTEAVQYASKKLSVWEYSLDDSCNRFLSELAKTANNYSATAAKSINLSLERAFNYSVMISDNVSCILENATKKAFSNLKEESVDEDSLFKDFAEAADSFSTLITEHLIVGLRNVSNLVMDGILVEASSKDEEDHVLLDDLVEAAYNSVVYALGAAQNFLSLVSVNSTAEI
jgi:hypothetical protein